MSQYTTDKTEIDFNFQYPDANDPMFAELKIMADISVDSELSELEKVKVITGYGHNLFAHNGDNVPSAVDPLTILKEAQAGQSFRCVEYSLLAVALLWAHGVPARMIGLKTSDVETREYGAGHVVIEFWSQDFQKLIMCDVQAGIIPEHENVLLSALEFGEKTDKNLPVEFVRIVGSRFSAKSLFNNGETAVPYIDWIKEYLYFYDTPIQITFADINRQKQQIAMLVPLGVRSPKMFQGMFEMNAVYTHSVLDFYPKYQSRELQ